MKGKFLKYGLIALAVILVILASSYYVFVNKFYDMTEKLILENVKAPEAENPPPQSPQNPQSPQSPAGSEPPATGGESSAEKPAAPSQKEPEKEANSSDEDLSSQVTFNDKRRIMQLVSSKLTGDDISYLTGLLKGGLTPEEKKLAVDLALKRFTQEEIREIQNLYYRYQKYAY